MPSIPASARARRSSRAAESPACRPALKSRSLAALIRSRRVSTAAAMARRAMFLRRVLTVAMRRAASRAASPMPRIVSCRVIAAAP